MSADPSRRAAADVLVAILDERVALGDALARTAGFDALDGRDRGFARAIVSATLRRLGGIDAILARFVARPLPANARLARALLRTGAAQLLVLGTPAHAAVSETVAVANADRGARPFAKLINAVLRRVAAEGPAALAAQPAGTDLPAWLFAGWRAAYSDRADDIARALQDEPPLDLTVKADAATWAETLGGAVTPLGGVRLTDAGDPTALSGFEPNHSDGSWWVQDAAATIPARLLLNALGGDIAGARVLDLCAAPGGKTLQLAAAGAQVTAVDKSERRLRRLQENLARTGLAAEVVAADALTFESSAPFDAVLLDAPCTATGTLRRRPDAAWLKSAKDVAALADLQRRLLAAAARHVKQGGVLVFCTCSLQPEEGPDVVARVLADGAPLAPDPVAPDELPGLPLEAVAPDGAVRTLPSFWPERGGMDGFFVARLRRAGA